MRQEWYEWAVQYVPLLSSRKRAEWEETALAASLAVAAAGTGERVIALDLDPQASLVSWSERRKAAKAPNNLVIEPLESGQLPQLHAVLEGLTEAGFAKLPSSIRRRISPLTRLVFRRRPLSLATRSTRLDVEGDGNDFSRCWPGEAQSPRSSSTTVRLPARDSREPAKPPRRLSPRSCSRTDTLRTNGFSGRHWCRLGRFRIRARRQGSKGNRGALALDLHPVSKHTE